MIQNHNSRVRFNMEKSNDLPSHDVTGYPRIKRGDPFNLEKNAQRFAVISMFNFAILKGESKNEAARSCGYRLATIILWNRAFQGTETRWPYERIQGYKYQETL